MNSCGISKGRDSSSLKVLVMGQSKYIWVTGSLLRRMPRRLVFLMQYEKLRKNGEVYLEFMN